MTVNTIPARKFLREPYLYLNHLPIVVTKWGKEWLNITEVAGEKENIISEKLTDEESEIIISSPVICPKHSRMRTTADRYYPCGCDTIKLWRKGKT